MTERIEREDMFAQMARLVARRSSCTRAQVGCLIIRENRIIVTGYNGTPAGMDHCNHGCTCYPPGHYPDPRFHDDNCPSIRPCTLAIHAEANAIAWAAREGLAIHDAWLLTTMAPCVPCAQLIIAAGIEHVTYLENYRDMSGAMLLNKSGVFAR